MSAPLKLMRPVALNLRLPEDVRGRVDLFLYSPAEGRVPKSAYQNFFLERIQEFFDWKRLDLEVYGMPPGFFVRGPAAMVEHLKYRLELAAEVKRLSYGD